MQIILKKKYKNIIYTVYRIVFLLTIITFVPFNILAVITKNLIFIAPFFILIIINLLGSSYLALFKSIYVRVFIDISPETINLEKRNIKLIFVWYLKSIIYSFNPFMHKINIYKEDTLRTKISGIFGIIIAMYLIRLLFLIIK
jgi:hypothetical protein